MAEASGSACTQCSSPFCLGLHEWIDNSCDEIFGGVDVDALLSKTASPPPPSASVLRLLLGAVMTGRLSPPSQRRVVPPGRTPSGGRDD